MNTKTRTRGLRMGVIRQARVRVFVFFLFLINVDRLRGVVY